MLTSLSLRDFECCLNYCATKISGIPRLFCPRKPSPLGVIGDNGSVTSLFFVENGAINYLMIGGMGETLTDTLPATPKKEKLCIVPTALESEGCFLATFQGTPNKAMSYRVAVEELKRGNGKQFDPDMVELFLPIALATAPDEVTVGRTGSREAGL